MANELVKYEARRAGVKLWQIAEKYGCTDSNFSRRLRRPLCSADEQRVLEIIKELQEEAETNA